MKSQLVSLCIGSLCFVSSYSLNAQESWQSQLVIQDESGNLTYKKDNDGFVKTTLMIDESHFDLVENYKLQFNAVLNSLNGNDILIRNILNSNEKNVTSNYSITIIEEEI